MNQNSFLLLISARSPFVRRIRLALKRLQLPFTEEVIDVFASDPKLSQYNPLGMIPTLITPEKLVLTDSANILEYLHEKTQAIWPEDFQGRIQMRQASIWCEGMMQASILFFQEKHMHEVPSQKWLHDHFSAIADTCHHLTQMPESIWLIDGKLTQAAWDLCVALQYIELRIPELEWRIKFPGFVKLIDLAMNDAFFKETMPKG